MAQQKETLKEKQARRKLEATLHAENFYHYTLIARATGITEDTLKNYRDDDQDFSEKLEKGRTKFLNKNIQKARPEFLLERLESEIFKERKEQDVKVTLPKPILRLDDDTNRK